MFFQAELRNKKWVIEVFENQKHFKILLQKEGEDKQEFEVPKTDYQLTDDAISFLFENKSYMLNVVQKGIETTVYTRGSYRQIKLYNEEMLLHESLKGRGELGKAYNLTSGMPGKIVKVLVKEGDRVSAGQTILIMEAMKMENDMKAQQDVTIKKINVSEGQSIESGAILVEYDH